MKKLIAAVLFFGSCGVAAAQVGSNQDPYYYNRIAEYYRNPLVRAAVPVVFPTISAIAPVIHAVSAVVGCGTGQMHPWQVMPTKCPADTLNKDLGYAHLPSGTQSCSVGANLGDYCYRSTALYSPIGIFGATKVGGRISADECRDLVCGKAPIVIIPPTRPGCSVNKNILSCVIAGCSWEEGGACPQGMMCLRAKGKCVEKKNICEEIRGGYPSDNKEAWGAFQDKCQGMGCVFQPTCHGAIQVNQPADYSGSCILKKDYNPWEMWA